MGISSRPLLKDSNDVPASYRGGMAQSRQSMYGCIHPLASARTKEFSIDLVSANRSGQSGAIRQRLEHHAVPLGQAQQRSQLLL